VWEGGGKSGGGALGEQTFYCRVILPGGEGGADQGLLRIFFRRKGSHEPNESPARGNHTGHGFPRSCRCGESAVAHRKDVGKARKQRFSLSS